MLMSAALVFIGGGIGAAAREAFMLLLHQYSSAFPIDIFAANILASFVLGIVTALHRAHNVSDHVTLLVGTGFAGGMSTFSSYIYGSYSEMTTAGHMALGLLYIVLSLIIGFGAAWVGISAVPRAPRS